MTRINLVHPSELTDQHLFAEFREIKMVPKALARSLKSKTKQEVLNNIPKEFTLGTGHVMFFYDKGLYLKNRYEQIKTELDHRGINYNKESEFDPEGTQSEVFSMDYTPDSKALSLIRQRIAFRISEKPHWYKMYGYPLSTGIYKNQV